MFCITRHAPEAPARSGEANRLLLGLAALLALAVGAMGAALVTPPAGAGASAASELATR
jgi:hypothetical protein